MRSTTSGDRCRPPATSAPASSAATAPPTFALASAFAGRRAPPSTKTVLDVNDGAPNDPEDPDQFEDADGVPDPDNDKDGINDVDDKCPLEPEDKDGFEDVDGCADPDNDNDGIKDQDDACPIVPGVAKRQGCPDDDKDDDGVKDKDDECVDEPGPATFKGCPDYDGDGFVGAADKCPKEAEVVNGFEDDDGCPDKGKSLVVITKNKIEILQKVYFDVNKDIIQARSYELLDQVATVLKSHPELSKVRIEGHTDSDGSDQANLDLSQRRTQAVKKYLVDKGVQGEILEAVGYGETRPVEKNDTKAHKEANRRVEFSILEIDGKPVGEAKSIESPETAAPK